MNQNKFVIKVNKSLAVIFTNKNNENIYIFEITELIKTNTVTRMRYM